MIIGLKIEKRESHPHWVGRYNGAIDNYTYAHTCCWACSIQVYSLYSADDFPIQNIPNNNRTWAPHLLQFSISWSAPSMLIFIQDLNVINNNINKLLREHNNYMKKKYARTLMCLTIWNENNKLSTIFNWLPKCHLKLKIM